MDDEPVWLVMLNGEIREADIATDSSARRPETAVAARLRRR